MIRKKYNEGISAIIYKKKYGIVAFRQREREQKENPTH